MRLGQGIKIVVVMATFWLGANFAKADSSNADRSTNSEQTKVQQWGDGKTRTAVTNLPARNESYRWRQMILAGGLMVLTAGVVVWIIRQTRGANSVK